MKKELFVVIVNDYFPELCEITVPHIKRYANKINAKFTIISERKFPLFPPTYEKLQIYDLGKDNDYNILLDVDILILKSMYDVTELVTDKIGVWMDYDTNYLFKNFNYPKGLATNFVVVPNCCHEVWKPIDNFEEIKNKLVRPFIVDEYIFSKNLWEHNYKYIGIIHKGIEGKHFYHLNVTTDSVEIKETLLKTCRLFLEGSE